MVLFSPRIPDKAEDFQEVLLDAGARQGAGLTESEHAAMVGTSLAPSCLEALCQAGISMLPCLLKCYADHATLSVSLYGNGLSAETGVHGSTQACSALEGQ